MKHGLTLPTERVTDGETTCEVTLADGQVRIHLPFAVGIQAFSEQLLREGFPLAHPADTPDTQGWGPEFDANGYYPFWVYPDPDHPGRSVFAFFPQPGDVTDHGAQEGEAVYLGEYSTSLARRWVSVLAAMQLPTGEVEP